MIKYVSGTIPVTTAGSVNGTDVSSFDDNQNRKITGVIAIGAVAGQRVRVVRSGGTVAEIDGTAFNAAGGLLPLDVSVPAGVQFHFDLNNTTGGSSTAVQVVTRYEV